jgi:hypothetical protein
LINAAAFFIPVTGFLFLISGYWLKAADCRQPVVLFHYPKPGPLDRILNEIRNPNIRAVGNNFKLFGPGYLKRYPVPQVKMGYREPDAGSP